MKKYDLSRIFKSCGGNEVCSVHDQNGLPTAFCECNSGYHVPNVTDSRLEVLNFREN